MNPISFPTDYSETFSLIDKDNPYRSPNIGLFEENGIFFYLPEGIECSCPNMTVVAPPNCDLVHFLEASGWMFVAVKQKIMLICAQWNDAFDGLDEESFFDHLNRLVDDKTHYDAQRLFSYLAGYSEAASPVFRAAIRHPERYAGIAFVDIDPGVSIDPCLKKQANFGLSVPVTFFGGECTEESVPVLEFVGRNNCIPRPWHQGRKTLFLPDQTVRGDVVTSQHVADVLLDPGSSESLLSESAADDLWKEVSRTIRVSGIGAGDLHPNRSYAKWGLVRHDIDVDGIARYWLEYIPKQAVSRRAKRPLVVFLHGGSQTGASASYAAEWMNVAEARDFIVVFPTGTMRDFGTMAPHPAWNAQGSSELFDDEKFIRSMIDDVCSRMNVDRTRIYVTGHSMGSAMTQRCALAMPELFAAAASNSGVVTGGFMGDFDSPGVREDLKMPVMVQMGEHDVGGGRFEDNSNAARTVAYWINRGDLQPFDRPLACRTGRYGIRVWRDKRGIPLLSYVFTYDKPHCITPQDAWMYYDWFFSRYSRRSDGVILYMGMPV